MDDTANCRTNNKSSTKPANLEGESERETDRERKREGESKKVRVQENRRKRKSGRLAPFNAYIKECEWSQPVHYFPWHLMPPKCHAASEDAPPPVLHGFPTLILQAAVEREKTCLFVYAFMELHMYGVFQTICLWEKQLLGKRFLLMQAWIGSESGHPKPLQKRACGLPKPLQPKKKVKN